VTIPRIAPEGTTYGASFDLNPPFARKITRAKANPYSNPYKAPCHHVLELLSDKPAKRATRIPFKIAAKKISVLNGSSRAKKFRRRRARRLLHRSPGRLKRSSCDCHSRALVTSRNSTSHDVNGQNAALMTGQQIIDEITDDRVRLVS
jgi:hypothetical protein